MVTATITNIVSEGQGVRVFFTFSDDNHVESLLFDSNTTKTLVKAAIKTRVDVFNDAASKASSLQSIIGEVVS